jgi:L-amino acid N-acyltransferase YncA
MFYIHPQYFADTKMRITSIYKKAVEYAKQNNLQWSFTKQKMAKDIKKELPEEYFKRTNIYNYYDFPDEEKFVEYLKTQRPQLLIDYI